MWLFYSQCSQQELSLLQGRVPLRELAAQLQAEQRGQGSKPLWVMQGAAPRCNGGGRSGRGVEYRQEMCG